MVSRKNKSKPIVAIVPKTVQDIKKKKRNKNKNGKKNKNVLNLELKISEPTVSTTNLTPESLKKSPTNENLENVEIKSQKVKKMHQIKIYANFCAFLLKFF